MNRGIKTFFEQEQQYCYKPLIVGGFLSNSYISTTKPRVIEIKSY